MEPLIDNNQQFCLRWHNYQTSLLSTLPQLLDGDDLTDVTLSAGGRNLKAHKVVLSACSHYFKQLFKEIGSNHHPVIVLPGVEFSDLCALVTFMYSGEVNIYQQQLASLLSMADTLHIRGLAEFSGDAQDYSTNKTSSNTMNTSGSNYSSKIKRQRLNTNDTPKPTALVKPGAECVSNSWLVDEVQDLSRKSSVEDIAVTPPSVDQASNNNIGCLQSACKNVASPDINTSSGVAVENASNNNNINNNKSKCSPSSTNSSKLFATCFICGKQLSNQYNLRVHMETHQNAFYACSSCSHVSRSRDALRKHVSYRHPHVTP